MTQTVRMQIISAIVALLEAAGTPTANVNRARLEAFTADQLPAYNVFPMREQKGQVIGGVDAERKLVVRIECLAQAASQADVAIEPLYLFAVQQMQTDPTLGALVDWNYETSSEWTLQHGGQDIVALAVDFEIQYMTLKNDPTTKTS